MGRLGGRARRQGRRRLRERPRGSPGVLLRLPGGGLATTLPTRRHGYKWVHDPGQRVDPGAQHAQSRLARQLRAADPGLDITWRGRVLRQRLENSTIGEVTLGEASARATWGEDFPQGAEVPRARLDGREVWVLRCPNAMRLNQTLIVVIAPDGWWMKVRVPRA